MPHALFIMMLALNAGQTPSEPPAALRRPNLQVLKTMPESQLFPVMNALADSLGVRCDHCHVRLNPDPTKTWSLAGGWVWDRDDKRTKIVAREMMRLVLDINRRQGMNGAKVTCFTCHRGSPTPERFPPLPPREYSTETAPAARCPRRTPSGTRTFGQSVARPLRQASRPRSCLPRTSVPRGVTAPSS
jgi:hypothetical protein